MPAWTNWNDFFEGKRNHHYMDLGPHLRMTEEVIRPAGPRGDICRDWEPHLKIVFDSCSMFKQCSIVYIQLNICLAHLEILTANTSFIASHYPLPNEKILDWSKFIALVDDRLIVTEKLEFVWGRVENIVGKGEITGYQHFLLFPQCFRKASFSRSLKVRIV